MGAAFAERALGLTCSMESQTRLPGFDFGVEYFRLMGSLSLSPLPDMNTCSHVVLDPHGRRRRVLAVELQSFIVGLELHGLGRQPGGCLARRKAAAARLLQSPHSHSSLFMVVASLNALSAFGCRQHDDIASLLVSMVTHEISLQESQGSLRCLAPTSGFLQPKLDSQCCSLSQCCSCSRISSRVWFRPYPRSSRGSWSPSRMAELHSHDGHRKLCSEIAAVFCSSQCFVRVL